MEAGMEGYGKRVLLVDNDHHSRFLMASMLAGQGYNVVPACDGLTALTELSKRHFDLVITHDRIPRLSGIEFLKQVRARYPRIPVILTTELQEHTFIHNDCLPFAFAPKPHDEAGLIALVRLAARATNEDDGSVVSVQQRMGRISSKPSLS
jgi:two-component system, NtrC family, response regulator PilR